MGTQCTPEQLSFQALGRREVVGRFDGGRISSDGGGVLLRETDRRIGLLDRLARCFVDYRNPNSVEHGVAMLVAQRVYGLALGYEDLNDHDALRSFAGAVGGPDRSTGRISPAGARPGLSAGGIEHAEPSGVGGCRPGGLGPLQADCGGPRGDGPLAGGCVCGVACGPASGDLAGSGRDRRSGPRPSGRAVLPRLLPPLLLSAFVYLLRRAPVVRAAAAIEHRRFGRQRGGVDADRGADPPTLAGHPHRGPGRLGVLPRVDHELVRGGGDRLCVRPGAQCAAGAGAGPGTAPRRGSLSAHRRTGPVLSRLPLPHPQELAAFPAGGGQGGALAQGPEPAVRGHQLARAPGRRFASV